MLVVGLLAIAKFLPYLWSDKVEPSINRGIVLGGLIAGITLLAIIITKVLIQIKKDEKEL